MSIDLIQSSDDFFCDEKVLNVAEESIENDPIRLLMLQEACNELNCLSSDEQLEFFARLREEGEWQLLEDIITAI